LDLRLLTFEIQSGCQRSEGAATTGITDISMLGVIIAATRVYDQLTAAAYLIQASAQEVSNALRRFAQRIEHRIANHCEYRSSSVNHVLIVGGFDRRPQMLTGFTYPRWILDRMIAFNHRGLQIKGKAQVHPP